MNLAPRKVFTAFLLAVLILGLLPITAYAASPSDIIIGNSYTLDPGESINDDLLIMGGSVSLLSGSTVNGSVTLIGGSLNSAGTVNGDITVLGGTITLASTSILNGDLTIAGASLDRDPGAQITGQIHTEENIPYLILPGGMRLPTLTSNNHPLLGAVGFFLRLFLWVLIAMIGAMFIPAHLERVSQTALTQPLISGGLGLLTIIIIPIIVVLLAITICLIPAAIIVAFLLAIAWVFGLIAIGLEVGKRIREMLKQEWHPAISAGLGTFAVMILLSGLEAIIPCVGWIPKALVGFVGLGAVLLTQFGMKPYTPIPVPSDNSFGEALPA